MNWRTYAVRVAVVLRFRWWLRSPRAPTATQLAAFSLVMPFVVLLALVVQVVWLLTGRARRIRHALGWDEIQVVPGARGMPPEFRQRTDALIAQKRAEFERMQAELERTRAELDERAGRQT